MNISKRIPTILKLIKENSTKVEIYMSYKAAGDDFDPYEKNYTYYNTNPLMIKAYVTEVSPEGLVWKAYGLKEMGAKEIFCDSKYENWFRLCNKVKIDGDEYEVYKEGTGGRAIIQKRPHCLIRVMLQKK